MNQRVIVRYSIGFKLQVVNQLDLRKVTGLRRVPQFTMLCIANE
ncbi:MAG: hypothetical protein ACYS3N_24490 [Planctomycetota bacterium]|jgi:hypothetical protein